jgi:uncharacterized membrane protein YdjX (TVP38/TMEM64 family)
MKKINWKKIKQYLPIAFMGLCIIVFLIFTSTNEDFSVADFLEITRGNPALTSIAVIIAFIIKGFVVFLPYAVIAISAMALMDFPVALMTVIVGTIINISVPYWTGRLTKDDWIQKILNKFPKIRPYYEMSDNCFLLSFTLRAMNLSNEGLGLLFGSAGLKYIPYLISSLIAIMPSAISYIILGKDMNIIESIQSPIFWAAVVIDVIMVLVMTRYYKRKKQKPELEKAQKQ